MMKGLLFCTWSECVGDWVVPFILGADISWKFDKAVIFTIRTICTPLLKSVSSHFQGFGGVKQSNQEHLSHLTAESQRHLTFPRAAAEQSVNKYQSRTQSPTHSLQYSQLSFLCSSLHFPTILWTASLHSSLVRIVEDHFPR